MLHIEPSQISAKATDIHLFLEFKSILYGRDFYLARAESQKNEFFDILKDFLSHSNIVWMVL